MLINILGTELPLTLFSDAISPTVLLPSFCNARLTTVMSVFVNDSLSALLLCVNSSRPSLIRLCRLKTMDRLTLQFGSRCKNFNVSSGVVRVCAQYLMTESCSVKTDTCAIDDFYLMMCLHSNDDMFVVCWDMSSAFYR